MRIAPDGKVTILTAGAEMGQGSMTALPMIVAEEMDADWSKVALEWAPADAKAYGYSFNNNTKMMAIVGSRATMLYYNDLRIAGAQVRKVLLANAAEKWGVDAATLRTEPGFVVNPANGQKLGYGEIAAFGKIPSPLPAVDAKELKPKKDWRMIGKGVARRDTPAKVNGSAVYGMDVRLPGMVYATTLHSPVHNTAPESWNDADIKKMPGVIATVKLPNGIAVVANHFEQALAAKNAHQGDLAEGQGRGLQLGARRSKRTTRRSITIRTRRPRPCRRRATPRRRSPAPPRSTRPSSRATSAITRRWSRSTRWRAFNDAGDQVEIWEGTQAPDISRTAVAKALGFKERAGHAQPVLSRRRLRPAQRRLSRRSRRR